MRFFLPRTTRLTLLALIDVALWVQSLAHQVIVHWRFSRNRPRPHNQAAHRSRAVCWLVLTTLTCWLVYWIANLIVLFLILWHAWQPDIYQRIATAKWFLEVVTNASFANGTQCLS